MTPVFLDSSGVIALLNDSDPHHDGAKQLAEAFATGRRPRLTTTAVLTEVGDGFARKRRWTRFQLFLAVALKDPLLKLVPVDQALLERASAFRNARPDKDWGLTDCTSFVVMADNGLEEALTADHHFRQAGFRALLLEE
jgi:uncharacterized protein